MATTGRYNRLHGLSDAQRTAIDALVAGSTHQDAADAAGVHRVTVSKWVSKHPAFRAELNRRRQELLAERRDRIRQMDRRALETVAERLESGDPESAFAWLRLRGLGKADVESVGHTDPGEIIDAEANRRLQAARARATDDLVDSLTAGTNLDDLREQVERELAEEFEADS